MQRRLIALVTATALAAMSLVTWGAAPGAAAAPALTVTAPVDGSGTADATPTIAGTSDCTVGACSDITIDIFSGAGSPIQSVTASRGTSWSATASSLPDGSYSVVATQSRPGRNGGVATSGPVTFLVDTAGPVVTIDAPDSVDEGSAASVSYTIDDGAGIGAISTVEVTCSSSTVTNETNSDTSGGFECAPADGSGSMDVSVGATDALGNVGPTAGATIEVRNVAPTVIVGSGPSSVEERSTATYRFSLTDPGRDPIATVDATCGSGSLSGLTFDDSTASFECTFSTPGDTSVGLSATDADGATGSSAPIEVHVAPLPTPQPAPEPTEEPTPGPTPTPTEDPTPEPTAEPGPLPTPAIPIPLPEPTPEPTEEPTPEPSPTPTEDPTPEPSPTPTEDATPEPSPTPTEEPGPLPTPTIPILVPEPTEEPVPGGPTPEPTESAIPEPTRGSTPEPAQQPTPEPTDGPDADPDPVPDPDSTPESGGVGASGAGSNLPAPPPDVVVEADAEAISPNGDGVLDGVTIQGEASVPVAWTLIVTRDTDTVAVAFAFGDSFRHVWDGTAGGDPVPDGTYEWEVRAAGPQLGSRSASGRLVVDGSPPELSRLRVVRKGRAGAVIRVRSNEDARVIATISRRGRVIRFLSAEVAAGDRVSLRWRGRDAAGRKVRPGRYSAHVVAVDRAGNRYVAPRRSMKP